MQNETVYCLVCDKALKHDVNDRHTGCVYDGGFMLVSFHYGSTHDQCHGFPGRKNYRNESNLDKLLSCDEIEAFICDDCFVKKADKMQGYDIKQSKTREKVC